jgi:hypothetical protein
MESTSSGVRLLSASRADAKLQGRLLGVLCAVLDHGQRCMFGCPIASFERRALDVTADHGLTRDARQAPTTRSGFVRNRRSINTVHAHRANATNEPVASVRFSIRAWCRPAPPFPIRVIHRMRRDFTDA